MKANLTTLAIVTCLAIGTCAYAQEGFIRPELSYNYARISVASPAGIKLRDEAGYGIASGASFGAQNEQELGLSVSLVDFKLYSKLAGTSITGKIRTLPILANYRYYFSTKTDAVRFFLAPSAGFTSGRSDVSAFSGGTITRTTSSGNDVTWGAGFGALVKVADKIDLNVSYRHIEFKESDAQLRVNTLSAGANIRF